MKRSNRRPTTLQVELLEPRSVPAGMIGPGFLGAHETHRPPESPHGFGEFHRENESFGGRAEKGRNDCGPRCENFAATSIPVDSGRSVAFAYFPSPVLTTNLKSPDPGPSPVARISPPATSQNLGGNAFVAEQGRSGPVIVTTQFVSLPTPESPARNERAAAPTDAVFAADDGSGLEDVTSDVATTSSFSSRHDDSPPAVNAAQNRLESLWDEALRQQMEEVDEAEPMEDLIERELQSAWRRRLKSRSAPSFASPLPTPLPKLNAPSDFFQEPSWKSDRDTALDNVVWRPSDDGLIELPAADHASTTRTQISAAGQAASQLNSSAPLEGELGFFQAVAETLEESAAPATVVTTAEAVREPAP